MTAPRLRPGLAALLALAALALLAAPAQAAPTKIAGWGHGPGRVNGPQSVAVDQGSGDLYVADSNNKRIDKFNAAGEFLLAWGYGVADGKSEELQVCGPEALNSEGQPEPTRRCFATNFATQYGGNPENNLRPEAVAVEQSGGEVYVAEPEMSRVSKFDPDGHLIYMLGREVDKTSGADICTAADLEAEDECGSGLAGAGPGEFTYPTSLALDSAGRLWVGDSERLKYIESDGTPGSAASEIELPGEGPTESLAIDPTSGDFFIARSAEDERQRVEFEGLATGDTFRLGGLPAGCTASETGPIAYAKGFAGGENIREALEAKCGAGSFRAVFEDEDPPGSGNYASEIRFTGPLAGIDQAQLSCAVASGTGSCGTSTIAEGVPGRVQVLEAGTGTPLGSIDEGGYPRALGIDSAGRLYVGDCGAATFPCPYRFKVYDTTAEPPELVSQFGAGQVLGAPQGDALAVDEGGGERPPAFYSASSSGAPDHQVDLEKLKAAQAQVAVQRFDLPAPGPLIEAQQASGVLPGSATLGASLNPEGHRTTYHFEYGTSEAYGHSTEAKTLEAAGEPDQGYEQRQVEANLEGLAPETTYHFRLVASDEEDPQCPESAERCTAIGPDATFTTLPAVGIEAQWASEAAARGATLNASLNPLGAAVGEWWVEYDTAPYAEGEGPHAHGASLPAPAGSLPAGTDPVGVAVSLAGLAPARTYHYRFVATDTRKVLEDGEALERRFTVYGPDRAFATQPAGLGLSLPDSRAWEMVSPPDKHGGLVAAPDAIQGGSVQAAGGGEALAYLSYGSLEATPEGSRLVEQSTQLARRGAGGAWATRDLTPPHTAATPFNGGNGLEYKLFDSGLGRALLEPSGCTALSPQAGERTPYLRSGAEPPAYTPLVSPADAPGASPFGGDCTRSKGEVSVAGASPDLAHVVLFSVVPLAPGASREALYEWSAGGLEAVSVKPGAGAAVAATLGSGGASVRGAVSADGSRVFFTAGGLYVRDTARDQTLRLDDFGRFGGFGTGAAEPVFQAASADGRVAFFADPQNLTPDANEEGADLYRWRSQGTEGCAAPGGCLEDLSAQPAAFGEPHYGESARVLGLSTTTNVEEAGTLPGIAADGSRAYFLARGVLDPTPNREGEGALAGQPNLYVWQRGEGLRFVARLDDEGDKHDWGLPGGRASRLSAAASPSGRYLAFMSKRSLTGYDNRDAASGQRAQEVFRYDAGAEALDCVSCNPSGARPRARVPGSAAGQLAEEFDPLHLWSGTAVAGLMPEATALDSSGVSLYRPRAVFDDGRVFFNAADALVPADSNGAGDVYEYEPFASAEGAPPSDTCTPGSAGAGSAVIAGGCVSLLSSGAAGGGGATFLDASESGNDVFFYTPAPLSVTDTDSLTDVYDARVGGEPARLHPVAECQGEACQPPASPPATQTPASAAFRGPGDLKEKSAARGRCAKPARRAKRLSRRAKRMRRMAGRSGAARLRRRAAHLAGVARRQSRQARRCRRRASKRGGAKKSAAARTRTHHRHSKRRSSR